MSDKTHSCIHDLVHWFVDAVVQGLEPIATIYRGSLREEGGRVSSTSMSINLDRSRDSLLDQSVCSNPRDESGAVAASSSATTTATVRREHSSETQSSRKRKADQSEK